MSGKNGKIALEEVIPSLKQGFGGVGFFFGAGTSFEAGYPLLSTLSTEVINNLEQSDKNAVQDVLSQYGH